MNLPYVLPVMNLAENNDNGVISATHNAIIGFIEIMNASVPRMVRIPVKNLENPSSIPSARRSTSPISTLSMSPVGLPSIYLSGSFCILANRSFRIERETPLDILTHMLSVIHCIAAAASVITHAMPEYLNIPSKSTLSLPTIRFVISPKIFGRNNSPATYSAEVISDRIKTKRYL